MEVFNNKGECCGCGLCTTVCKKCNSNERR